MRCVTRLALCAAVIVLAALPAWAGGGYFASAEYTRREGAPQPSSSVQQAYLMHFDGTETLCLQSNYRGPEVDFAWVVPVPSRPEVSKGNPAILQAMEGLSRPLLVAAEGGSFSLGCRGKAGRVKKIDLGVTMLESRRIGEMELAVLSARDGGGLLQWLNERKFHLPPGAEPLLQSYSEKGFYFVALRFAADQLLPDPEDENGREGVGGEKGEDDDDDDDGERTGPLLKLRFATERPYFPLLISSVSAAPESEILLLTVTEHRQRPVGYAFRELREMKAGARRLGNRPELPETPVLELLKEMGRSGKPGFAVEAALPTFVEFDADGRPGMAHLLVHTGRSRVRTVFLTRFHAVLTPGQMTRDLYFADTESDRRLDATIKLSRLGGPLLTITALAALPLGLCGLGRRPRTRRRRRTALLIAVLALVALA
ncbi:MAG: DUF2330 domain-containing protein [Anaerolineaceae bacterium]|nr:DUF2330 domain-containing protein [Anaerolineaceae bacterium]